MLSETGIVSIKECTKQGEESHNMFTSSVFFCQFCWCYFWLARRVLAGQQGENRTTLVFFLGGVTYAEIAALRFLSQMEDSGMEYIIATTKLMNGTTWIKSLMDRPESQNPWNICQICTYGYIKKSIHYEKEKLICSCPVVHCSRLIVVCAAQQIKTHFLCLLSAQLTKLFFKNPHQSLFFIFTLRMFLLSWIIFLILSNICLCFPVGFFVQFLSCPQKI